MLQQRQMFVQSFMNGLSKTNVSAVIYERLLKNTHFFSVQSRERPCAPIREHLKMINFNFRDN